MRVLVIDDNAELGDMLVDALTSAGYEARYAADGQAAVRAYRAYGADVVVVDMFMPGMDGLELIARLTRNPNQMRIIGISGGGRAGDLDFLAMAARLGPRRCSRFAATASRSWWWTMCPSSATSPLGRLRPWATR